MGDAEKSLCWLRGWVSRDAVAHEFREMQRINEKTNHDSSDTSPGFWEKITEFKQKRTFQPFIIVLSLYLCIEFSGVLAMQPYILQIFKAYNSPISPDKGAALLSFLTLLASFVFICIIHFTGKRRLYLSTTAGTFLCLFVIACYGFIYLPPDYNSFDQQNHSFVLEDKNLAFIPFICIFLRDFFVVAGLFPVVINNKLIS